MKLLLFDIDGTILKMKDNISKKVFSDKLKILFNCQIDYDHLPDFLGMTDLQIINDIAIRVGYSPEKLKLNLPNFWEQVNINLEKFCTVDNIDLMPGFPELLEKLDSDDTIKLALLTGNIRRNAYSKLSIFSLGKYFQTGAFGDEDSERSKLVALAISRANELYSPCKFDERSTLIIGDSFRDIECGIANSIPVMAVATGGMDIESLKAYHPDYLFENLSDTQAVLKTINQHFN